MDSKELVEKLNPYPDLKLRVEELLKIVENDDGEILSGNVAEQRVIDSLRGFRERNASKLGRDNIKSSLSAV